MRGTSQVIRVEIMWTTQPMSEKNTMLGKEIQPPVWTVEREVVNIYLRTVIADLIIQIHVRKHALQ